MHSLRLFVIKMGTPDSRARLYLDFAGDTAVNPELWLANGVPEIRSSDALQQAEALKHKIRIQTPCDRQSGHHSSPPQGKLGSSPTWVPSSRAPL